MANIKYDWELIDPIIRESYGKRTQKEIGELVGISTSQIASRIAKCHRDLQPWKNGNSGKVGEVCMNFHLKRDHRNFIEELSESRQETMSATVQWILNIAMKNIEV